MAKGNVWPKNPSKSGAIGSSNHGKVIHHEAEDRKQAFAKPSTPGHIRTAKSSLTGGKNPDPFHLLGVDSRSKYSGQAGTDGGVCQRTMDIPNDASKSSTVIQSKEALRSKVPPAHEADAEARGKKEDKVGFSAAPSVGSGAQSPHGGSRPSKTW